MAAPNGLFLDERCEGLYPATCTFCENMNWVTPSLFAPANRVDIICRKGHWIKTIITRVNWRKLMRTAANCPDFGETEGEEC